MPFHSGRDRGGAVDLVVRDRDRFPDPIDDGPGLALEPRPQHRQRDVGGLAAGGLAADAVDDHEQAARDVDVNAILVDLPLQAGIGLAGRRSACWSVRIASVTSRRASETRSRGRTITSPPQSARKRNRAHKSNAIIGPSGTRETPCPPALSSRVSGSAVSTPFSRLVPSTSS